MTADIYEKVHSLIWRSMKKAERAGNTEKYEAAKARLADFEYRYAEDFGEKEDTADPFLDPAFGSWNDYYNYMYR